MEPGATSDIKSKPIPPSSFKSGNISTISTKFNSMMNDFSEFDPSTMEWGIYKDKIDNYFISIMKSQMRNGLQPFF